MTGRAEEIGSFLSAAGWSSARRVALAGDASARRYERLWLGPQSAILMDAPPGGDTPRFVEIANWLIARGFQRLVCWPLMCRAGCCCWKIWAMS